MRNYPFPLAAVIALLIACSSQAAEKPRPTNHPRMCFPIPSALRRRIPNRFPGSASETRYVCANYRSPNRESRR